MIPPTITIPRGIRLVEAAPKERAIGRAPNIMARLVINIGRKRMDEASTAACILSAPLSRIWFAYSTMRIPFLVTSPINMIIPISENILSVWPNIQSDNKAPANAKGTVSMIIKGSIKLSNCAANMRYIRPNASRNANEVFDELST